MFMCLVCVLIARAFSHYTNTSLSTAKTNTLCVRKVSVTATAGKRAVDMSVLTVCVR